MSSPAAAPPLILFADPEEETFRSRTAAIAVAAAAVVLAAAPPLVAVVAIVNPGALDSVVAWVLGGTDAFSVVAAGRVPAAALIAVVVAWRTRS